MPNPSELQRQEMAPVDAVLRERERCAKLVREFLVRNDQSAVSWHEVQDVIDRILRPSTL